MQGKEGECQLGRTWSGQRKRWDNAYFCKVGEQVGEVFVCGIFVISSCRASIEKLQ